jgi:hypothetical protein
MSPSLRAVASLPTIMLAPFRRFSAICALLAVVASLSMLGGDVAAAAPKTKTFVVTNRGVAAVHLGASAASLRRKNLIGNLRKGCELEPGQQVAPLDAPLRGWATFGAHGHGLTQLTIEGGAETARHVAVGSTASEARGAYPNALYEGPGTVKPFAQGFLWIPSLTHPKMTFIVEPGSRTVEAITVPSPAFCE